MITVDIKGRAVPALGFGTWRLEGAECVSAVRNALDLGYRHIDTAIRYGNEREVGQAIAESGIDRSEIFLTTKLRQDDLAAPDVRRATAESLARLGTDYVDLLLVHWPNPDDIPLRETMDALADMQAAGRTRHIGVSNYPVAWMHRAIEDCGADIVVNQVEYHPFLAQPSVLAYCRAQKIVLTAHVPLARGGVNESDVIRAIATDHGKTPSQVTLRWLVQQDGVAAVPKSAHRERICENFEIFDFALSDEEMARISTLSRGMRLVDPAWAPEWDVD